MRNKVLIIEDNEQNRYMLKFLLKSKGYEVYESAEGLTGVEMAKEILPDFILLDIQLPEMDGYEVASRLRKTEKLKETPIIVVTSYAMPGDREKAIESGATGYIEKPINPDTFIDQMRTFLPEDF